MTTIPRATRCRAPGGDHRDDRPEGLGSGCRALGKTAATSAQFDDEPGHKTEKYAAHSD